MAKTAYDNRQTTSSKKSSQVISGNDVALYRALTIASMAKLNLRSSKAIPMHKKIGHDDLKLKNAKMLCSSRPPLSFCQIYGTLSGNGRVVATFSNGKMQWISLLGCSRALVGQFSSTLFPLLLKLQAKSSRVHDLWEKYRSVLLLSRKVSFSSR